MRRRPALACVLGAPRRLVGVVRAARQLQLPLPRSHARAGAGLGAGAQAGRRIPVHARASARAVTIASLFFWRPGWCTQLKPRARPLDVGRDAAAGRADGARRADARGGRRRQRRRPSMRRRWPRCALRRRGRRRCAVSRTDARSRPAARRAVGAVDRGACRPGVESAAACRALRLECLPLPALVCASAGASPHTSIWCAAACARRRRAASLKANSRSPRSRSTRASRTCRTSCAVFARAAGVSPRSFWRALRAATARFSKNA